MAKIAFIWYFDKAPIIYPYWRDGHRAVIDEIGKKHDVEFILGKHIPEGEYDFVLFWDDSNSEFFKHLDKFKCRKGICLTTDPHNIDNLKKLYVVFCESDPVLEKVRMHGIRAIKAFGTDTDFFTPNPGQDKNLEYFYPATFSPWKLQRDIAHLGNRLLCVGTVQPDGMEDLEACKKSNVQLEIGYFPAQRIKDHYQRAKHVIIPAVHGSERTVLEAMSCDIQPEVTNKGNVKAQSYIQEYLSSEFKTPREFVVANYSAKKFAEQLLKGIEE